MKRPLRHLVGTTLAAPLFPLRRGAYWLYDLQNRERTRLYAEMTHVRGLIPLLMKQRNGNRWSAEDRHLLKAQLGKLLSLSPYLVLFLAPGGFFALPVLAWWLDRRRRRRLDGQQPAAN